MRHIFSVQRDDGSFPEVGMIDRWLRQGVTRAYAVRLARDASRNYKRRVRVETWLDQDFYKPDTRPLVTIVG